MQRRFPRLRLLPQRHAERDVPLLYITNLRENILYRNDGAAGFAEVGGEAGAAVTWSTGAAFGDYDADGDVDLYVAGYAEFDPGEMPRLGSQWKGVDVFVGPMGLKPEADRFYRNDDGRFADVTAEAGLAQPEPGYGFGVLFVDGDDDGDADLYVANDSSPNFLYRNDGDGIFAEVGLQAQVAYGGLGHSQAGMGVAWGDYDGDGRADIFTTHFEDDYNTLYRNEGAGLFVDVAVEAGLGRASFHFVGFGTGFFDHDNDGDLDLLVANGHVYPQIERSGSGIRYAQPDQLFDNRGGGHFALLLPTAGDSLGTARVSRGSAVADYDDDGDLDILVANLNDRPTLLRNDVGNGQNWLGVKLVGAKSNRGGIGARLRLVAGGGAQVRDIVSGSSFLSSEDPRAHFGLGRIATVDSLVVRWPSGTVQVLKGLRANQYLVVEESTAARR
ncbi:MAG: CRTAC1 family protein [Candidatus Latescibacterota bacterium]|nr:CRTAC1 family protein [Candidatus Latescibacterota bacterium]